MTEDSGDRGSLAPDDVLEGRYRIVDVLGEGGVGVVYRAEHVKLKRPVAIKILKDRYVEHVSLRPRFEREAKALAAMSHPNVVAIGDYGVTADGPYVVMEMLTGRTLRELLDDDAEEISSDRALVIFRQLLRGLAYAHVRGLLHRDIKPGNVFLHETPPEPERAILLDFGFAKFVAPKEEDANKAISAIDEGFGTPAYIAPEQATGHPMDARTDVYSAGVVLFEMLSGKKPFEGEIHKLIRKHLEAPLPRFSEVGSRVRETAELRLLLERALAKKPEDRYADAGELLSALDALPRPVVTPVDPVVAARRDGGREPRRMLPWIAAGVLCLLAIWVWALSRPSEPEVLEEESAGTDPEAVPAVSIVDDPPDPEPVLSADPPEPVADAAVTPRAEREPVVDEGPNEEPVEERSPSHQLMDPVLARIGRSLEAGENLSGDELTGLREMARADRRDPRPNLLLGWGYYRRGWWTDSVERYQLAWEAEPSSLENPRVLQHLLEIAKSANVGRRAAWLIDHAFGRDALPSVERAIENPAHSASVRGRLRRLREEILDPSDS